MSHLKEHGYTYFEHMKIALKITKFGLMIAFYSVIHSLLPGVFKTNAGHSVDNAYAFLTKMRKDRNIIYYTKDKL